MAGTGPAPKAPDERRNRAVPLRGEWVELKPLERPVLPTLPRRAKGEGPWPATTLAMWTAWRKDPVSAQWSPSEVAYALDTIRLHAVMTPSTANEVRLRMDGLGLTPKGKRDLRYKIAAADEESEEPKRRTSKRSAEARARLSIVK